MRHVNQLTFGGQNAEAYFSYDGRRLIFMSTREPYQCDQIFIMNTDGSDLRLGSTGKGRTTLRVLLPRRQAKDTRGEQPMDTKVRHAANSSWAVVQ